jgi:hypothetical protein
MAIDFPSSPTNGQTYTSGGTTWVYDSAVPAWNLENTVISGPTGPTGPTGPAGTAFAGYDNEIHVSGVDGSDSTGNGDLLNPVATIAYAITLVAGSRNTIVVHPGTYAESPTLTAKTFLKSAEAPANNDGPFITGTVTVPTAANQTQITGLSIGTLTITGTASATMTFCNVAAVNKSSSGTVIFFGGQTGSVAVSGSIAITGTGVTRFVASTAVYSVTQNNASSTCIFSTCQVVFNTVNTTGNMFFANSSAFTSGTYAVQSAGGNLNISNSSMFNATGTVLNPITVTGGSYIHFSGSLNFGLASFNHVFSSWGTTTKTINIRVGSTATSVNMYANQNYHYNVFLDAARPTSFTLMEIAQ